MHAVAGAALALLSTNGVVWAEGASGWLDDQPARPGERNAAPEPRRGAAAVTASAGVRPGQGHSLRWERIVRTVEERHEASPPEHPVAGPVGYGAVGAEFGAQRAGHVHEGQDIFAPAGTPLVAVRDGVVVDAGTDAGRGNHIAIYSKDADQTYVYLHMLAPAEAAIGDRVEAGAKLGQLGCTGSCSGDHLHFELHAGRGAEARPLDPMPLLERLGR